MKNSKSAFHFREFSIIQDHSAMKVGTDGVLLGAWADFLSAHNILDVGTGTGVIALICAQRNPSANIFAIEPEPSAFEEAVVNFSNSPWHCRIHARESTFQDFSGRFDAIISNPPFFNNSIPSPDHVRTSARHTSSLSHGEIIEGVTKMLISGGKFHVVLPVDEGMKFMDMAVKNSLFLERHCLVHSEPGRPIRRLMTFTDKPRTIFQEELIIRKDGRYSESYLELTRPFYLSLSD